MKKTYKLLFLSLFLSIVSLNFAFSQDQDANNNDLVAFTSTFDALIYPNPVLDNKFYVNSDEIIKSVEVINVIGKTIKTVNNETNVPYNILVRFDNCIPGMYMIKITSIKNEIIIKKILIK